MRKLVSTVAILLVGSMAYAGSLDLRSPAPGPRMWDQQARAWVPNPDYKASPTAAAPASGPKMWNVQLRDWVPNPDYKGPPATPPPSGSKRWNLPNHAYKGTINAGTAPRNDTSEEPAPVPTPSSSYKPNAYGLGVGMDQYGRPVTVQPVYPSQGGYYGDSYIKTPNAYGPGISMDQYGRPVQVVPR